MERGSQLWTAAVAGRDGEDGTDPEDLAIYLESLDEYRDWFFRESPAEYLRRLDRILDVLDGDLATLARLLSLSEEEFLRNEGYRDQALWRLFHALVALLEASKWLLAREMPKGERPHSFTEAFRWLAERGVLPPEKVDVYRDLSRLRNRLAHSLDEPPPAAEVRTMIGRWLPELQEIEDRLRRLAIEKDGQIQSS